MLKSQSDIDAQAERIIAMAKGTHRFMCCKAGKVDKAAIYKLARVTKSQHGFSIFDKDKKTKHECIHPYVNNTKVYTAWWNTDEFREELARYEEERKRHNAECRERKQNKGLTDAQRMEVEVKMNDVCNHAMMKKVLAWVAADMTLKVKLGLPGDPFEVPKWLIREMSVFLPKPKQLELKFD